MRNHPALKSKETRLDDYLLKIWHILISTFGFEMRPSNYIAKSIGIKMCHILASNYNAKT